jgi:hypothetical protein
VRVTPGGGWWEGMRMGRCACSQYLRSHRAACVGQRLLLAVRLSHSSSRRQGSSGRAPGIRHLSSQSSPILTNQLYSVQAGKLGNNVCT